MTLHDEQSETPSMHSIGCMQSYIILFQSSPVDALTNVNIASPKLLKFV